MYANFNRNIQAYKHLNRSIAALTKLRMRSGCTWMTGRAPVVKCRLEMMEAKKASHFWGKHYSLSPVSVSYPHPETARTRHQSLFLTLIQKQRERDGIIGKHIPSHFNGAKKSNSIHCIDLVSVYSYIVYRCISIN